MTHFYEIRSDIKLFVYLRVKLVIYSVYPVRKLMYLSSVF